MNFPSDLYVAEMLKRAGSCIPKGSPLFPDVMELSRYFELRFWFARLTMADMERVMAYAQECARRSQGDELASAEIRTGWVTDWLMDPNVGLVDPDTGGPK